MSATVQLLSLSLVQSVKFVEHGGGGLPRTAILPGTTFEYPNSTGDGRLEGSVLRMLVDKLKPSILQVQSILLKRRYTTNEHAAAIDAHVSVHAIIAASTSSRFSS
jgi:hypothetical protein